MAANRQSQSTSYKIRALGVGGILDSTFRLFVDRLGFVLVAAGILYFPVVLAFELSQAALSPNTYFLSAFIDAPETPGVLLARIVELLNTPVTFVLAAMLQGTIVQELAMRIRSRNAPSCDAIRFSLRRFLGLLILNTLYGLGAAVGYLLFIVPGFLFALRWYVVIPVYVVEGAPLPKCFSRSARLMKGQKGNALVVGFFLMVLNTTATIVIMIGISNVFVLAFMSAILVSVFNALGAIGSTVIYFSARCANENLDLELAAESMEEQVPEEAASPL